MFLQIYQFFCVQNLSGILLDGAYRLRVANGDVDVFIPGPLRLSGRDFDEEEALWNQYPCSVGEDQFNPYDPQPGKDCISRYINFYPFYSF